MRKWINALLGSIIAFFGYGCHTKKVVIVDSPEIIDSNFRDERNVMYGTPDYFIDDSRNNTDTVSQKKTPSEPPILLVKYGVPNLD